MLKGNRMPNAVDKGAKLVCEKCNRVKGHSNDLSDCLRRLLVSDFDVYTLKWK